MQFVSYSRATSWSTTSAPQHVFWKGPSRIELLYSAPSLYLARKTAGMVRYLFIYLFIYFLIYLIIYLLIYLFIYFLGLFPCIQCHHVRIYRPQCLCHACHLELVLDIPHCPACSRPNCEIHDGQFFKTYNCCFCSAALVYADTNVCETCLMPLPDSDGLSPLPVDDHPLPPPLSAIEVPAGTGRRVREKTVASTAPTAPIKRRRRARQQTVQEALDEITDVTIVEDVTVDPVARRVPRNTAPNGLKMLAHLPPDVKNWLQNYTVVQYYNLWNGRLEWAEEAAVKVMLGGSLIMADKHCIRCGVSYKVDKTYSDKSFTCVLCAAKSKYYYKCFNASYRMQKIAQSEGVSTALKMTKKCSVCKQPIEGRNSLGARKCGSCLTVPIRIK